MPTGFNDLDEHLAGLQPSNLIVVGARPSMGKTAFALGIAAHAASNTSGAVLLARDEPPRDRPARALRRGARRRHRMRNGRLLEGDWPKITNAIGRIGNAPLHIDDNPNVTVMDIRAKARRMKTRDGLGLVVVDYLQLMTGRTTAENRQVEISEISRGLKILARELEIPVVALSQLSRDLEAGRTSGRCSPTSESPALAGKRSHRAGRRRRDVHLSRRGLQRGLSDRGTAEVIVAKHRNGPTGAAAPGVHRELRTIRRSRQGLSRARADQ